MRAFQLTTTSPTVRNGIRHAGAAVFLPAGVFAIAIGFGWQSVLFLGLGVGLLVGRSPREAPRIEAGEEGVRIHVPAVLPDPITIAAAEIAALIVDTTDTRAGRELLRFPVGDGRFAYSDRRAGGLLTLPPAGAGPNVAILLKAPRTIRGLDRYPGVPVRVPGFAVAVDDIDAALAWHGAAAVVRRVYGPQPSFEHGDAELADREALLAWRPFTAA